MHWLSYLIGTGLFVQFVYALTHPFMGEHVILAIVVSAVYFVPMLHLWRIAEGQYRYMKRKYEVYLHEEEHDTVEDAHAYALQQLRKHQDEYTGTQEEDPLSFPRTRRRLSVYALIPLVNWFVFIGIVTYEDYPSFNGVRAYMDWAEDENWKARKNEDMRMIHRATKRMHDPIPKQKEDRE